MDCSDGISFVDYRTVAPGQKRIYEKGIESAQQLSKRLKGDLIFMQFYASFLFIGEKGLYQSSMKNSSSWF